jgi:hypothetical protein
MTVCCHLILSPLLIDALRRMMEPGYLSSLDQKYVCSVCFIPSAKTISYSYKPAGTQ